MNKRTRRKVSSFPTNPRRAPKDTDAQKKPTKKWNSQAVFPAVIEDLQERERTGIKTYGQSLHTLNGRSALKDAYQEVLDLAVYLKQWLMEEAQGDFLPITPWKTPDLARPEGSGLKDVIETRPVEHFPAPIAPPTVLHFDWLDDPLVKEQTGSAWTKRVVHFFESTFLGMKKESVLQEAERLVNGDRGANYGHPLDDFSRTAGMLSSLLSAKLKEPITAEDVAKIMVCVKLSRETNKPGRDNRVDAAGYIECLDKVIEERARRGPVR